MQRDSLLEKQRMMELWPWKMKCIKVGPQNSEILWTILSNKYINNQSEFFNLISRNSNQILNALKLWLD